MITEKPYDQAVREGAQTSGPEKKQYFLHGVTPRIFFMNAIMSKSMPVISVFR
jgi:hypothetical protein